MTIGQGREFALGFVYWLTFLLVLEPGNIAHAAASRPWEGEAARILGASLLGAAATPFLLALTRRFPIEGDKLWRHAAVLSLSNAGIALALIVASCILAPWVGIGDTRPFLTALPEHLQSNWLLLAFCLAAFTAVAHAARFMRRAEESRRLLANLQAAQSPTQPNAYLSRVEVRSRGHVTLIDLADVDRIETQGNYLALHAAGATHLLRDTLASFESKLNPNQFIRIHRRTLVAISCIREVSALTSGDAEVTLTDGTTLRLSRSFRERVRKALTRQSQNYGSAEALSDGNDTPKQRQRHIDARKADVLPSNIAEATL